MARWFEVKERGAGGLRLRAMLRLYRLIGPRAMELVLAPVAAGFLAFAPAVRAHSLDYLRRLRAFAGGRPPGLADVYRHIKSFARSLLDKVAAWSGELELGDLDIQGQGYDSIIDRLSAGKGAVVLCSHLGNPEMLRALAQLRAGEGIPDFAVTSIVDFTGTAAFNAMIERVNPTARFHLVHAGSVGPDTVIELCDRIEAGELVVIAGDRIAAGNEGMVRRRPFLGAEAEFPLGPFILATILECPVYLMTGARAGYRGGRSRFAFHVDLALPAPAGEETRAQRRAKAVGLLETFVRDLESKCLIYPFQWFNFFDFWETRAQGPGMEGK